MRGLLLRRLLILVGGPCMMTGCGMMGPPVPPEMVGVAPIIERQKQQQSRPSDAPQPATESALDDGSEFLGPVGQDELLPPLRPIGTR